MKAQWQVGMSSSMRERRSRHDRTCLWQSTVVMVAPPTVVYDMVVPVEDWKAYQVVLEVVWVYIDNNIVGIKNKWVI